MSKSEHPQVALWESKGRAAFRQDPEAPLGRALARAGISTAHPFYIAFQNGWQAEMDAYEATLSPRGRSNYHFRCKLRENDPAEQRRKLKDMVK